MAERVMIPWRARGKGDSAPMESNASSSWLKSAAVIIGVASALCALVGYGVAWAYTAAYGFSHGIWYDNGLELIGLSGEGLLGIMLAVSEGANWSSLGEAVRFYGIAVAASVFIAWCGAKFFQPRASGRRRAVGEMLLTTVQWLVARTGGWGSHLVRGVVASALGGTAAAAGVAVGMLAIVAALTLVAIVPLVGFIGGTVYAQKSILLPQGCVGAPGKRMQSKPSGVTGAPCIEVVNPVSKQAVLGRVILARSSKVILYLPEQDQIVFFPLKGEVVRTSDGRRAPAP